MIGKDGGSRPLRIAHLFQAPDMRFNEPRAAQLHMYHTIRSLQALGHHVSLLALQGRQVLYTDELVVFDEPPMAETYFGRLGLSDARLFKSFESVVRRSQQELHLPYLALFDSYRMREAALRNLSNTEIIHERFNLLSIGGALASRRLDIPFVLEINADLIEQRRLKGKPEKGVRGVWAQWSTRLVFNTASKIVSVSAGLKDHLRDRWGIADERLAVVPCAADVEAFQVNGVRGHVRQELNVGQDPTVMWIGGFYRWHDLDLLVQSFEQVLQELPEAKLVLVGDGETRQETEEKIAQAGLEHAVRVTGAVAHSRIPEILSAADVVVSPAPTLGADSGGTGTPLKLFEYMAAGKAIVATAVSQAMAVLENERTSLLVEPYRSDVFASAIVQLLRDPVKRQRLGESARSAAVSRHSWQQYARQLEKIYAQLV